MKKVYQYTLVIFVSGQRRADDEFVVIHEYVNIELDHPITFEDGKKATQDIRSKVVNGKDTTFSQIKRCFVENIIKWGIEGLVEKTEG